MTTTDFSQINEEDIHSGKYVFRDVFDVGRYLVYKGWNVNWYAAPQFETMEFAETDIKNVPMPASPLYRGQNEYYTPCFPSLYRTPEYGARALSSFSAFPLVFPAEKRIFVETKD